MQYKILFVDDETANLRLLERLFRGRYEVLTAPSAEEALKLLEVHDVALIVSDQRMPAMSGLEFLKLAAGMRPQTVRIMLTGYTDSNDLVDAINSGVVYKYLTKPWVNEELQLTVKRALQHYETAKAQRQLQLLCERLQARLLATRDGFVEVILGMLDVKVPASRDHARRTAELAGAIGARLNLEWHELDALTLAARLHDVALFCGGTDESRAEAPWQPPPQSAREKAEAASRQFDAGLGLLERVQGLSEVAALLRFRYERFDGTGHPVGFAGAQIPIGARIIAVAEAYDKLRHHPQVGNVAGSSAATMTHEDAVAVLRYECGKRFDPEVVEALAEVTQSAELCSTEWELFVEA